MQRVTCHGRHYDGVRALSSPDTYVADRDLDLGTLAAQGMTGRRFPPPWSIEDLGKLVERHLPAESRERETWRAPRR
jgi:hypothetical protein